MKSRELYRALCNAVSMSAFVASIPYAALAAETVAAEKAEIVGEDILVTARRRSESMLDVPIAMTVLTSETIEKRGIESIADIANLAPNVSYDNALNLGTNFLVIRGQGQSQYSPPPAAIVVDGVLTISPLQFNVDEFDLQQVEVLKGPQGAIYGRNAIAGAINISSRKPGDVFEARALARYGRGEEYQVKASVSGPIVADTLSVLAGVSYVNRRGQVRNITTGKYSDKMEDLTARFRSILTPAPDVEVDVKYTYSDAKGRDPAHVISTTGDPSHTGSDVLDSNVIGTNPRKLHDLSGRINYNTSAGTATVTLAYVDVREVLTSDFDFMPLDIIAVVQRQKESGFSQEFRFASPEDSALRWLIGAYHSRSKRRLSADIYVDPFYFGITPEPTQADMLLGSSADLNRYQTWSGFGNVEYDILPNLELAVGVRYDDDKLHRVDAFGGVKKSFSKWQPKGTLTFKASPDLMLYGSVGVGYRSGDLNSSGASFGAPIIASEAATNYEIGAKGKLVGGMVQFEAAIFQTDLKNGQFKLFDAVGATNVGVNIDKTRIKGFEVAGAVRPVEGLTLNVGLGYTDPKIRSFTPPPGFGGSVADYIGNRPPRISRFTGNVGLDFEVPLSDTMNAYVAPEYRYTSSLFFDLENDYRRPVVNMVDLRAGLREPDGKWSVTGWVKNALNEKVIADYQPFATTGHPLGIDAYYPPVGATYGIELFYRF